MKCGCSIYFFLNFPNLICQVRISRSTSESPLELEIMRVNCISIFFISQQKHMLWVLITSTLVKCLNNDFAANFLIERQLLQTEICFPSI